MNKPVKNKIKGSLVKRNLEIGKKVELEHAGTIKKIISDPKITVEKAAELIAKDHIAEMPDYYDKLMVMESGDWVEKIKDMRSEIKEIILNDGTVVKGEKMTGGGKSGEEFAESVKNMRSQIKKIILHDGTEIPGKKIMQAGGKTDDRDKQVQEYLEEKYPDYHIFKSDSSQSDNIHSTDFKTRFGLIRARHISPSSKGDKPGISWSYEMDVKDWENMPKVEIDDRMEFLINKASQYVIKKYSDKYIQSQLYASRDSETSIDDIVEAIRLAKLRMMENGGKFNLNPYQEKEYLKLWKDASKEKINKILKSIGFPKDIISSPKHPFDLTNEMQFNVYLQLKKYNPEIKGLGKFIPIAKIKEITEYFDNHKKPHGGEDAEQAEGYAWLGTMEKYSILGDDTIVNKILDEHMKGKSLMDIHKEIKKMEDGGKTKENADAISKFFNSKEYNKWMQEINDIDIKISKADENEIENLKNNRNAIVRKIREKTDELTKKIKQDGGRILQTNYETDQQIYDAGQKLKDENINYEWSAESGTLIFNSKEDRNKAAKILDIFKNGGTLKPGMTGSMKELLEQSSAALENRYLLGRMDEKDYKQRVEDIKTYAKKHNIEFEHGGKTNKQPKSLYFPDDKLDYTNDLLIEHGWATVGGRIEEFYETLKNKGREKAYDAIKNKYGSENADEVYRTLLVMDRLKQMDADSVGIYSVQGFRKAMENFEKTVAKRLSEKGEYNHYLMSKPVLQWDNYDYANYKALSIKYNFADGGTTGATAGTDTIQQLIADGFINEDHTLTNKGRRIADLHKFCFPIGAHPFSYVQYSVEDLYSKPQYVLINDTIYYTDGFRVYELGGHLTEDLRDAAVQNHNLENSVNKTISKNLVEYSPYAYCPGVSIGDKVTAGEGFIVFSNVTSTNEIYLNSNIYNYIIRHYKIASWLADPNGGSLIHALASDGSTQAILMVNANAVGVNSSFTLFDRDKLMGDLRNKHTELFIKGGSYKEFIGDWKSSESNDSGTRKPADLENTIRGLEVLVDMEDDEAEIKRLNNEIYKLKSLLK